MLVSKKIKVAIALSFFAYLVILLALFGVKSSWAIRYLGYEAIYVLAPGWMLSSICGVSDASFLKRMAIGWGAGYALEVLVSSVCGAAGASGCFWAYPLIVLPLFGSIWWIRFRRRPRVGAAIPVREGHPECWGGLILLAALSLLYLGVFSFSVNPLPGASSKGVTYYVDLPWAMGTAAEAKNHWPITDPRISGESFRYYTFVYTHIAAISRVTGISIPSIILRLFPAAFSVVFVIQLFVLGVEAAEMGRAVIPPIKLRPSAILVCQKRGRREVIGSSGSIFLSGLASSARSAWRRLWLT